MWKIYYLCSLYLLLWCAAIFLLLCYIFIDRELKSSADFRTFSIIMGVVLLLAFKAVVSLRGIGHLKNAELLSKTERIIFIVTFFTNALFAILMLAFCIFTIIPNLLAPRTSYYYNDMQQVYINRVVAFAAFTLLAGSALLAVFDLILLKAIRKTYYNSLLVLGEDIEESKEAGV